MSISAWLEKQWWLKSPTAASRFLWPFSAAYGALTAVRRAAYTRGLLRHSHPGVPVIVVGNVVVGGAGKTPVVGAIVRCLQQAGYHPGVISRGYPVSPKKPILIAARHTAAEVGDEPLLHFALAVPVVVCANRFAAASMLLESSPQVDVIVADDALQHYALMRDIEVEVVSAERAYGNGKLLPAGPLRETRDRAQACFLRIMPSWTKAPDGYKIGNHHVALRRLDEAYALIEPTRTARLSTFRDARPNLVTGIANPRQFADALRRAGVDGKLHAFPDHHPFTAADFETLGERPILMTEKDAVKCKAFADLRMWVVPLTLHLAPETKRKLLRQLADVRRTYSNDPTSLHEPKTP
ncbi:MAG: tetraacyldisaccharide 4'-kinase [Betaproteobacteria bacterium]|nr:MAG: tetraacyldisaccharide 4'-kinase [Betaproteobacteria bacterium]TAG48146.1 MAG: tetraacyldisaccharide 4'-kinase [Betaproteobacteria bacterium]